MTRLRRRPKGTIMETIILYDQCEMTPRLYKSPGGYSPPVL